MNNTITSHFGRQSLWKEGDSWSTRIIWNSSAQEVCLVSPVYLFHHVFKGTHEYLFYTFGLRYYVIYFITMLLILYSKPFQLQLLRAGFDMPSALVAWFVWALLLSTTIRCYRTSLVVQWWGIRLPMQGTWVWSLVREDPTCCRATKPVHHSWKTVPTHGK